MERTEHDNDQEMLKRIAARLLRLAVLTERVSRLPYAIRFLVLWLLRPAEAIAREFVIEEAGGALALPAAAIFGTGGGSRADALRLAFCFRALAAVIGTLLIEAEAYGHNPLPSPACRRLAHLRKKAAAFSRAMKAWGAMLPACAALRFDSS